MSDFPHGETRGYERGCSCRYCRAAHAEYAKRRKATRAATPHDWIPHGVNGYVNYACRCPVCTEANTLRTRRLREKRRNHWRAAS